MTMEVQYHEGKWYLFDPLTYEKFEIIGINDRADYTLYTRAVKSFSVQKIEGHPPIWEDITGGRYVQKHFFNDFRMVLTSTTLK
ncbi:hypothetical protein JW979_15945 [bacterium]|nr:hypothetical protein [candidate division CSSED10-310 bacterium]